ncbi:hypothetical protein HMPREF0860_2224 [Treponema socranskii subsp. socranskii VPI DR56BR1116 = ATCC 35536]|uniref:Uncharacterized protein n=1 Tax=Treponema socranskii subsp. socranskii VPI DR56BR1116 = ATCC 35536 TaxID=1125725 RepID=U2LK77_TRESO|nr:hypothetical protein HMPREF1325_2038 [Treponema socranskii subsp. socranskii VPI DR56BR1116 = ATCC 35536]ERK04833.1 hypothetical protein HMPREF0860_2224 [Treponema socranskii subsp. socranskii VPI DR56BR1116 = ATCC 35536]
MFYFHKNPYKNFCQTAAIVLKRIRICACRFGFAAYSHK